MKKVFSAPTATLEQAQVIEKYLEFAHANGQSTGIISPGHLDRLERVLKQVRLRMARGEFKSKGSANGKPAVVELWNQVNPDQPIAESTAKTVAEDPDCAIDPGSVDYDYDAAERQAYDPNYDPNQS